MQNIPLFGSAATLTAPISSTVTSGYFPLQFLPAENLNYYLNATTQAVQELVNIITLAGNTPGTSVQLWASISGILSTWKLNHFAATSSWELAQVISDETGSASNGLLVFNNGPTLIAPVLGVATGTSFNGLTINATTGTLALTNGKTLTEKSSRTIQGTDGNVIDTDATIRGTVQGLTWSRASTTTFTIAAGAIGDSTFVRQMTLASALTKSTSAWAVGNNNGGLDTGAIAASKLYAVYLICRPDTGVIDVIFSQNTTSPTLPANYTLYRRICYMYTNGSSQFVLVTNIARQFLYAVKVVDLNGVTPASTNRILVTPTVPLNTEGMFEWVPTGTTNAYFLDAGYTGNTDAAASATNAILQATATVAYLVGFRAQVDGSNQIYYRVSAFTSNTLNLLTLGWIDNL